MIPRDDAWTRDELDRAREDAGIPARPTTRPCARDGCGNPVTRDDQRYCSRQCYTLTRRKADSTTSTTRTAKSATAKRTKPARSSLNGTGRSPAPRVAPTSTNGTHDHTAGLSALLELARIPGTRRVTLELDSARVILETTADAGART